MEEDMRSDFEESEEDEEVRGTLILGLKYFFVVFILATWSQTNGKAIF